MRPLRAIMAVGERARQELYLCAEAVMGSDSAETLMSLLPSVGWADVATKQDVAGLEQRLGQRLDGRIDSLGTRMEAMEQRILATMRGELNGMLLKMFALAVGLASAVAAIAVPLVTLI